MQPFWYTALWIMRNVCSHVTTTTKYRTTKTNFFKVNPFLTPSPGHHWCFLSLQFCLVLTWISQKVDFKSGFLHLTSLGIIWDSAMLLHTWVVQFFLFLGSIPLCGCNTWAITFCEAIKVAQLWMLHAGSLEVFIFYLTWIDI